MQTITILSASLTLSGLSITHTNGSLTLCPWNTCQALQDAGMIEGFELDSNGEPVILYTTKDTAAGYDGQRWCEFVKSFRLTNRYAEMIIEARDEREGFQEWYDRIDSLMVA